VVHVQIEHQQIPLNWYKDAFLLQDINIKMHKIMVLLCSATLNRLEIITTDLNKKIPSDQNTENMNILQ
jgi:hypothetical protein